MWFVCIYLFFFLVFVPHVYREAERGLNSSLAREFQLMLGRGVYWNGQLQRTKSDDTCITSNTNIGERVSMSPYHVGHCRRYGLPSLVIRRFR
ncbi:hypothetical protein BDD12DRAFT_848267 [Trichophaea hybrida]|nr:hypothetical protein BDD12DRAFT_848267 [Trichophaea hybrida]